MNNTNYWDTYLVIQYLEEVKIHPAIDCLSDYALGLERALKISGIDSGEACVYWMIKYDRMNLNQFWVGDISEIENAVIECKRRNER